MVASGVSVLAIVALIAQVSACPLTCGTYSGEYLGSSYGSGIVGSGLVGSGLVGSGLVGSGLVGSGVVAPTVVSSGVVGSGLVGSGVVSAGFGSPVQERVSPGTFSVALDNNGPVAVRRLPVIRTQATAPLQQRPTVRIPAAIPAPRTVSNCCKCVKTIVKPQIIEQVVTVPSVQRYIQTSSRPVVEKIHYNAVPVNGGCVSEVGPLGTVGYGVSDVAGVSGYGVADVAGVSGYGVADVAGVSGYGVADVAGVSGYGVADVAGVSGYGLGCEGSYGVAASLPVVESAPIVSSSCGMEAAYPMVSSCSC